MQDANKHLPKTPEELKTKIVLHCQTRNVASFGVPVGFQATHTILLYFNPHNFDLTLKKEPLFLK